jgi:K+-sensing histidine kinase KdpD
MSPASQDSSERHTAARAILGIVQWRIVPGSTAAYAFATVCVAVASLLQWGLGFLISEDTQHFTTFYPAVLFAALVGGAGAGIFAALLSGLIAWWAFMPPHFTFFPITSEQIGSLIIYLWASLFIVWLADHAKPKSNFASWLLKSSLIA